MTNKSTILGVDIGTSSLKVLEWDVENERCVNSETEKYCGVKPDAWWNALVCALGRIDLDSVVAIGLTSQVGTYVINNTDVIAWSDPVGSEELCLMKEKLSQTWFKKEISMPHPNINSYPMPRLRYIKNEYKELTFICQPKDYLFKKLTGYCLTDKFSWRGLANLDNGEYSSAGLEYIGVGGCVKEELLPKIVSSTRSEKTIEGILGDKAEIPVYVGCNDFFASILGMGIKDSVFDITGTSEHIGGLTENIDMKTRMVSGPFFYKNANYGVSGSSGAAMDFCLECFGEGARPDVCIKNGAPIFLPYLCGERAPIWDMNASGEFFGVQKGCSKEDMAYAVMEGIVFNMYSIFEQLSLGKRKEMFVSGGLSNNVTLNTLKAELFNMPVKTMQEESTSALGAVMIAAVGNGVYADFSDASEKMCLVKDEYLPSAKFRDKLLKRYELFKRVYPALSDLHHEKRCLNV